MKASALISDDQKHRYLLTRVWRDDLPVVHWVMLNPSTADASQDDATIRRCIGFAMRWGYGGIEVRNLFTWRATDPRTLFSVPLLNDERSDAILRQIPKDATVVAAWGHPSFAVGPRMMQVKRLIEARPVWCLGITNGGYPCHPVRLPYKLEREVYWP